MSHWGHSSWTGEGLRREVFFFRSRGVELYGSLYAAAKISRPFGVVACNSWGVEADRCDPLQRSITLAMARLGGAGVVFHYPGFGDSFGDLARVSLTDLSEAASDAVAESSRRCSDLAWTMAGLMFGASVVCLAQRQAPVDTLLLIQPSLYPGTYFEDLAQRRQRAVSSSAPGERTERNAAPAMAYGYPIPSRIAGRAGEVDAKVDEALAAFEGSGAVIRHASPHTVDWPSAHLERVEAPGVWRFGSQNNPRLAGAAIDWLDQRTRDGAG